jgi:hypothetical protein
MCGMSGSLSFDAIAFTVIALVLAAILTLAG